MSGAEDEIVAALEDAIAIVRDAGIDSDLLPAMAAATEVVAALVAASFVMQRTGR